MIKQMDRFIPSRASNDTDNMFIPRVSSMLLAPSAFTTSTTQPASTSISLLNSTSTSLDAWVVAAANTPHVRRNSPPASSATTSGIWVRGGSSTQTRIHHALLQQELLPSDEMAQTSVLDESVTTVDGTDSSFTAEALASEVLSGLSVPVPLLQSTSQQQSTVEASVASVIQTVRSTAASSWRSPETAKAPLLLARDECSAMSNSKTFGETLFFQNENEGLPTRPTVGGGRQRRILEFRSPLELEAREVAVPADDVDVEPLQSPSTPSRRGIRRAVSFTPSTTGHTGAPIMSPSATETYEDGAALRRAGIVDNSPAFRSPYSPQGFGVSNPHAFALSSPARVASAAIRAQSLSALSPQTSAVLQASRHSRRRIGKIPFKVLDAPGLPDDFYLNILDWSSTNILAVGLLSDVYLWDGGSAGVDKLSSYPEGITVSSVGWSQKGGHLAVGLSTGEVQIWDVVAKRLLRTMRGHTERATAVTWAGPSLASCGRDAAVYMRDVRAPSDYHTCLRGHKHEVCGLRWSPDWSMLASGANDNNLLIWSANYAKTNPVTDETVPLWSFTAHKAAVKAIAWSPHQSGLIASGGGSHDRTIRFHKVTTGEHVGVIDVGAQVTQLAWAPYANELASTQGFSHNSLALWRYPAMTKFATLTGHQSRVLYMTVAPDGQSVVTGAADETLRFWNVFAPPSKDDEPDSISSLIPLSKGSTLSPLMEVR